MPMGNQRSVLSANVSFPLLSSITTVTNINIAAGAAGVRNAKMQLVTAGHVKMQGT